MEVNTSVYRVYGQVNDLFCTRIVQKMMIAKVNICCVYVKDGTGTKKIVFSVFCESGVGLLFPMSIRCDLPFSWICSFIIRYHAVA